MNKEQFNQYVGTIKEKAGKHLTCLVNKTYEKFNTLTEEQVENVATALLFTSCVLILVFFLGL